MDYERLMAEHDRLDILVAEVEALAAAEEPCADAVVLARDRLAGELQEHLRNEDSFIYSKLIRASDGGTAGKARAFTEEFSQLRTDWDRYLREWSADCIEADWLQFGDETRSIMARMRDRVRSETALLYPLALQKGAITLRP